MTSLISKSLTRRLALGSLVFAAACAVRAGELPQATPDSQHVSPAKLAVAEKAVQDLIDKKECRGDHARRPQREDRRVENLRPSRPRP